MKINLDLSHIWHEIIDPAKVEKKYNVKFVCETPIKLKNAWRDYSSLIFYGEKHPEGSNYMALSFTYDGEGKFCDLVVSDGISVTDCDIVGIVDGDQIIYSRYRHDYRFAKDGSFIDGGRDYIRSNVTDINKLVYMKIIDGKLVEVNSNENLSK